MKKTILLLLIVSTMLWLACKDLGNQPKVSNAVMMSIANVTVAEGQTARVVISLSKPSDSAVTFDFASIAGLAAASSDFTSVTGGDTIPAGASSDTVSVVTLDDTSAESAETFTLVLSNLSWAEFADSVATVTITDNDGGITLISFTAEVKPLLNANCLTCHGGSSTESRYSVATYNSVMTSGDRAPNVIAGNGAGSRLYTCLTTSPSRDIDRMPQGGPYLTTVQQDLIKAWIDQGALNN